MTNNAILIAMRVMLFPQYVRSDGKFEFYNIFEHGTGQRKKMVLDDKQMLYAGGKFGADHTTAAAVVAFYSATNPELLVDDTRTANEIAQQFPRSSQACCICSCWHAASEAFKASHPEVASLLKSHPECASLLASHPELASMLAKH